MENNKDTQQATIKVWKVSIPKTELGELPSEKYEGKITLVDTPEGAERAARILSTKSLIGFDTETKPSFRRGQYNTVSLLQLSTDDECFLIRLNHLGMPDCINRILSDKNILKIGLSIHDDFINLDKKFKIKPDGFIDLQAFVKQFHIDDNSLSRIYGILFGKRISKGQRLTNWEALELTIHQQEYAALDAKACLVIYRHLKENGFDYKRSDYYREFEEPAPHNAQEQQ